MISPPSTPWHSLRLLSLYRLLVSLVLLAVAPSQYTFDLMGQSQPLMYTGVAISYLVLSIFWLAATHYYRYGFHLQLYFQFATDVALITAMMHASGGLSSGLGILLAVSIAAASTLVRGIMPYFLAAIATLAMLFDTLLLGGEPSSAAYTASGALGAGLFGVALIARLLSRRLEESEALASARQRQLLSLEQLNEKIIEQFENGVIAVDADHRVQLINHTAESMLQLPSQSRAHLSALSPALDEALKSWKQSSKSPPERLQFIGSRYEIQPSFMTLDETTRDVLITLTDTSELAKEMQDQKLASLGRLTASIAHEIRNPLSAINHAAQLLKESPELGADDHRLTDIVTQQSRRLNAMVENIMQLSRKNKSTPEHIDLDSWLGTFRIDFCRDSGLSGRHFFLNIATPHQQTLFDPGQLHQVLWNLCANSVKYGQSADGHTRIHIDCLRDKEGILKLHIYDEGPGIPGEIAGHIFEPFYTTSSASSGLGLYIAHELCAFNHAQLSYHLNHKGGGYFALRLP
ncbi:MAG: sensor histidine kinase [Pseudomonadota bacterium]